MSTSKKILELYLLNNKLKGENLKCTPKVRHFRRCISIFSHFMFTIYNLKIMPTDHLQENSLIKLATPQPHDYELNLIRLIVDFF